MATAPILQRRQLGPDGPSVSALGLGCMSLSGVYGPSDDSAALPLIHQAIESGVNFFDTADAYGWGHNEELVGRAIRDRRERVVIATKFGHVNGPNGPAVSGRPDYVRSACEASLVRLGIEVIDLYYQHRVDPTVPIEETVGAMADLVAEGKVRLLGICEAKPDTVRRAHRTHPLAAVQSEYSLLYREEAEETRSATRELGISFVAYSPLGRSLLTGKVRTHADVAADRRAQHPRFFADNLARNTELVGRLEALAREKGCTPAQLAIAWLLAQGPDVVPIPGSKRKEHFDENLGGAAVRLTPEEIERLSSAFPPGAAAGTRYPEPAMKSVYV